MDASTFSTKEYAKQLRKDIEAAVAEGKGAFANLPQGFKVRVVSSYDNISIGLEGVSSEWLWQHGWNDFHGMFEWSYTPDALAVLRDIEAMRSAHKVSLNADDPGRDYHQCNYYGHTQWSVFIKRPEHANV